MTESCDNIMSIYSAYCYTGIYSQHIIIYYDSCDTLVGTYELNKNISLLAFTFQELNLKVGVPVMLLRNVPNSQMCNGLQGIVKALTRESVTVRFKRIGVTHTFRKETFTQ
jgi:peptidyl-tRNA hydrolase